MLFLHGEQARRLDVEARHVRFPVPDVGVPHASETMRRIVDAMESGMPGAAAYVHCWGGGGRTGTAVGCYLRRHGAAPEAALATVQRLYLLGPGQRPAPAGAGLPARGRDHERAPGAGSG